MPTSCHILSLELHIYLNIDWHKTLDVMSGVSPKRQQQRDTANQRDDPDDRREGQAPMLRCRDFDRSTSNYRLALRPGDATGEQRD
jgi:hypothetical protein